MHRSPSPRLANGALPLHARMMVACAPIAFFLGWGGSAQADQAKCPRGGGGWIDLIFSGTAWSPAQQESVTRELGIELSRRSLEVCSHFGDVPPSPPTAVVTLLSNDPDRVSIVPARLQDEGGFSGRTIRLGTIPADARSLAIAQAVDEALRGVTSDQPAPPAREAPPATSASATPQSRDNVHGAPPGGEVLRLAIAVGPALQIAPSSATNAGKTALTPGATLRVAITNSRVGGSIGVIVGRSTDLVFGSVSVSQFRLPIDASFRLTLRTGQLQGALDAGLILALLHEQYTAARHSQQGVEAGARGGLTLSWGERIAPWVGASVEMLPSPYDFRFAPMGAIGHTSNLWLGFSLGMEVRWP